jgi:hypothetical protein
MKKHISAIAVSLMLATGAANSGTLEITNCDLSTFSYNYTVNNAQSGILQIGSLSDDTISLAPNTVDAGSSEIEHDLSDEMPDNNVYVTLVDGDEITTRLCSPAQEAVGE